MGLPPHTMGLNDLEAMDCTTGPDGWQDTQLQIPPELAVSLVTQAWDLFLGVNEMRSLTVLNRHYLIKLIATVPIASLSLKGINTNGSVQLTGS